MNFNSLMRYAAKKKPSELISQMSIITVYDEIGRKIKKIPNYIAVNIFPETLFRYLKASSFYVVHMGLTLRYSMLTAVCIHTCQMLSATLSTFYSL